MFEFVFIWILILAPLPVLMYFFKQETQEQVQSALKIPFYRRILLLQTTTSTSRYRHWWSDILLWLIWFSLLLAAAGPQWLSDPIKMPQEGRNIMLAVDISGSMETPDMVLDQQYVSRLTAIKNVGKQFIDEREGDRLGLILFGSQAYLQTPLTFDRDTVAAMLDDASIGLAGQMTAVGDAIGLGIKRLMQYPAKSRILILLTDGSNNSGSVSPISAAEMAAKQQVKIYTIGFGSDKLTIPTLFGQQTVNPSSDLDEDTLKEIANTTDAQYFRAKDTQSLAKIYTLLNQLEPINSDQKIFRPVKPLYPWPLAFALLCSVLLLARGIRFMPYKVQATHQMVEN